MRRLTAFICAAAMAFGMTATAVAAPSIGSLIPEAPALVEGTLPENYWLAVQDADTASYTNETVARVVERFNDDEAEIPMTFPEVLEELEVDTETEIRTHALDVVVNPLDYESLTPFVDLVITDGTEVSYTTDGEVRATIQVEPAGDLEAEDLLLMQVDPETGEVYFLDVEEYDPETGEITATFPCLGPIMVLVKTETAAAAAAE